MRKQIKGVASECEIECLYISNAAEHVTIHLLYSFCKGFPCISCSNYSLHQNKYCIQQFAEAECVHKTLYIDAQQVLQ